MAVLSLRRELFAKKKAAAAEIFYILVSYSTLLLYIAGLHMPPKIAIEHCEKCPLQSHKFMMVLA